MRRWPALSIVALAPAWLAACAYDFTVGKKAPVDAAITDDGAAATSDAGAVDASVDAAVSCIDETVALKRARAAAVACTEAVECPKVLKDECGCSVPVLSDISQAAVDYLRAVERRKGSPCAEPCAPCPDTSGVTATCEFDPANPSAGFAVCAFP